MILLVCILPPAASAAEYEVEVCSSTSLAGDGITIAAGASNRFSLGCSGGLGIRQVVRGELLFGDVTSWRLQAPADTTIKQATVDRSFSRHDPGISYRFWELLPARKPLEIIPLANPVPGGEKVFEVNAPALEAELGCAQGIGCDLTAGGQLVVTQHSLAVRLEDEVAPPSVTADGPLFAGGELSGVQEVTFEGSDRGSGIARAELLVDGAPVLSRDLGNGGRCALPYRFLVPCALDLTASFQLDTTTVPDGNRLVQVSVIDAAGQATSSEPQTVTIRNGPANIAAPAISGTATVGAELMASSGAWSGEPLPSLAFQWLRCPAQVSAPAGAATCVEIAAANGPRYTLAEADRAHRIMVRVTATNQSGRVIATSAPSDTVVGSPSAPVLSAVSLRPKRIRSGRPATLRLTSSAAARLSIVTERLRPGRKRAGTCKPVRLPAGGDKCRAPKRVSQASREVSSGNNKLRLIARVGRKALAPGRYRLTLTATDADGDSSAPKRVRFAVVR